MALTAPRSVFGVHSVSPYSRTDGLFYGIIKVLKSSSLSLQGDSIELDGGSQKYAWAVEDGRIKAEMSLKFGQFEDFMFTLFLGTTPTAVATETTGSVTSLVNKLGTSCFSATIGCASIALLSGSSADLKFGKYVIKVASATTVDVYFSSDADLTRGTDGTYQNDLLKITATPLTITTGGVFTNIPNFGLKIAGGSGTIGMTTGDTSTFDVLPPHTGASYVTIGSSAGQTFPEFGAIIMAQKRGNQELVEVDAFRCKASGMPLNFDQNAWAEADVKVKLFYDSTLDGVFKMRAIKPSGT